MATNDGVYIVTGANAGIGKEIARKLALAGLPVVMVCRSPEKGEAARAEIRTGATGTVDLVQGDLGDVPGPLGYLSRQMKRLFSKPVKGADAPVWLATAPEVEGVNGKYFFLRREGKLTADVKNEALTRQFRDRSERLGRLKDRHSS